MEKEDVRFETEAIHAGYRNREHQGSLVPPLYQTSTFTFQTAEQGEKRFSGQEEGHIYSRLGNPTVQMLQERIAILEKGEAALAFSSGMAAVSAVLIELTKSGDHILCSQGVYGCTFGLLQLLKEKYNIDHSFSHMDTRNTFELELRPNTACIYIETPINPTMKLIDLEMAAQVAKERGIPVVVDNTFCSPYLQTPISLGCDVVIHSATKYICGHGDVIAGLVIGRKAFISHLAKSIQKDIGGIISPFDAWLLLRGIKTLPVRMDRHSENAQKLFEFFRSHPKVESIFYPGDPEHPDFHIMKKQMKQPGGMISFSIKGTKDTAQRFMNQLQLIKIAVSLGECETLIQHPATMTHAVIPKEERLKMGIAETLLRLSVGLEAYEDLLTDLEQALEKI
ncbi:methionine gamma-lyase [Bacillus sp. FJAT-29814]|uniref:methionine gamma-lyase n=1 Tax=Bacillus sp. FJAT-29814 TaxID=1729688 RepID=UPI00082AFAAA|nr:methionine gamma-lyase [Bacillus sp. FJAT-29814]